MTFHLYIMRHAKSDWSKEGTSDYNRPINKRGRKNAAKIGQWMTDNKYIPQQVISSPAVRAKQTTELLVEQLTNKKPDKIIFDKDLYLASLDTLIECIDDYKNDLNSLMLVAHNPGLEQLLHYLTRHTTKTRQDMSVTTANLMIFSYPDKAANIKLEKGNLLEFIKPRELD